MQAMFDLTDTQALVQASLTRWLADNASFERRTRRRDAHEIRQK